ncbi:MAG: hypothetical protein PHQ23_07830 [Candidatus Wallbacteria bacterium]|nr:hypothetical protein [Candidatus Wallbacteria bacterium]
MEYALTVNGREYKVEFQEAVRFSGIKEIKVNGKSIAVDVDDRLSSILLADKAFQVNSFIVLDGQPVRVDIGGQSFEICFPEKRVKSKDSSQLKQGLIRSPLQGLVSSLLVKPGQTVGESELLMTIEAMKMQNEIRSIGSGRVKRVEVREGQTVRERDLLLEIESIPAE